MKYVANLLLAVHTVAAAEAMALARRSGLDLELVQKTLDSSIASSAIWTQRGPLMAERAWSPALPVSAEGEPHLTRANVWDGLVLKADNALPFVPSMTYCEVTERHSDTVFGRDIDFRGQRFTERITLEAQHRVTFTRIAGPVLGTIANEIEGPGDDLRLRFSFALVVADVEGGSAQEQEYADSMAGDYLKAVAATLTAMRRIAEGQSTVSA